jgi:hypothetical protein
MPWLAFCSANAARRAKGPPVSRYKLWGAREVTPEGGGSCASNHELSEAPYRLKPERGVLRVSAARP